MLLGRIIGWIFIFIAALTASGEAVIALGTGTYEGIFTADVWTLVSGNSPQLAGNIGLTYIVMNSPAWLTIGPMGIMLTYVFRPRRRRLYNFSQSSFGR